MVRGTEGGIEGGGGCNDKSRRDEVWSRRHAGCLDGGRKGGEDVQY